MILNCINQNLKLKTKPKLRNGDIYLSNSAKQLIEFVINKKRMDILEKEQEKIGVPFKFFQVQCEDGSSQTQWTRLDGKNV